MPEHRACRDDPGRGCWRSAQRLRAVRRRRLRRRRVGPARRRARGASRQREVIAHAIGPIWEANHVWLILHRAHLHLLPAGVRPARHRAPHPAHAHAGGHRAARLGVHLPHLRQPARRGAAALGPDLRRREPGHAGAAGRLRSARSRRAASGRCPRRTSSTRFVEPWLTPFAFAVGLLALALFAFLAAVFLTLETDDPDADRGLPRAGRSGRASASSWRRRFGALLLAREQAPLMGAGLLARAGRSRSTSPPASRPSRCWRRSGSGASVWPGWRWGCRYR